jgi:membrane protein DedA with SNARE-associated domain
MDCLLDETWVNLLLHYGSFVLFVLLMLGIIALPIPEETLMVFAGALMDKGVLLIPLTIFAAIAGSICGITVSYFLGRTGGSFLVHRYGNWIGITEKRLDKAKSWFNHFGKWALFIGYFIPGLRHFTGFSAGAAEIDYRQFALFAYSGAIVWVSTFLSIGYFLGDYCFYILELIDVKVLTFLTVAALLVCLYLIINKANSKPKSRP